MHEFQELHPNTQLEESPSEIDQILLINPTLPQEILHDSSSNSDNP